MDRRLILPHKFRICEYIAKAYVSVHVRRDCFGSSCGLVRSNGLGIFDATRVVQSWTTMSHELQILILYRCEIRQQDYPTR